MTNLDNILEAYGKDVVRHTSGQIEGGMHLSFAQAQATIQADLLAMVDLAWRSHYQPDDDVGTYDEEGLPVVYLDDLLAAIKTYCRGQG